MAGCAALIWRLAMRTMRDVPLSSTGAEFVAPRGAPVRLTASRIISGAICRAAAMARDGGFARTRRSRGWSAGVAAGRRDSHRIAFCSGWSELRAIRHAENVHVLFGMGATNEATAGGFGR